MADFSNLTITNAGIGLITGDLTGKVLTFTKLQVGDGTITDDTAIPPLTALVSPKQTIGITKLEQIDEQTVKITGVLSSANVPAGQGFFFREIGVFAKLDTGAETLFDYSNAYAEADYIPASNEASQVTNSITVKVIVARGLTINAVFGSSTDIDAQNIGPATVGPGWYRDKTGTILNFKRAISNSRTINFTETPDTVSFDIKIPAGVIWEYDGTVPPSGWLFCDGSIVSRVAYPDLFAVVGTKHSAGDGTTTFGLPDFRGKMSVGAGTGTASGIGLTTRNLGDIGGYESVTLSAAQMPVHSHTATQGTHSHQYSDPGHAHSIADGGHAHSVNDVMHYHNINCDPVCAAGSAHNIPNGQSGAGNIAAVTRWTNTGIGIYASGTGIGIYGAAVGITISAASAGAITVANAGSGQPHTNMPPFLVINKIIKF